VLSGAAAAAIASTVAFAGKLAVGPCKSAVNSTNSSEDKRAASSATTCMRKHRHRYTCTAMVLKVSICEPIVYVGHNQLASQRVYEVNILRRVCNVQAQLQSIPHSSCHMLHALMTTAAT
jgi:hypothetical protein